MIPRSVASEPIPAPAIPKPLEQRRDLRCLWAMDRAFVRSIHRLRVSTPAFLPPAGPAILVSNHTSFVDPLLLLAASRRWIVWMVAAEYYAKPGLNWLLRRAQAIPVDRAGRDWAATRAAMRALERGQVLGLFPEGRIETGDELLPFRTGAALLAQRAGVAIYPAFISGTGRKRGFFRSFLQPQTTEIRFGPPLCLQSGADRRRALLEATDQIRQTVAALRPSVI